MPSRNRFVMSVQYFVVLVAAICLVGASSALAPTAATWTGGAGNWSPCPPTGNALWSTCPTLPNGNFDVTIQGGPVTESLDDETVNNLTLDSGDTINMDQSFLFVNGSSITNNGTINISNGNGLRIGGSTVTLSGTGTINLQTSNVSIVYAGGGINTFVNQQTINGQGSIGSGTLTLENQGTMNATGGTLTVQPSASGMINTGTLEASSGATLVLVDGIPSPLTNTGGTISALNGGVITISGPIITGGVLKTTGTGVMETPGGGGNPMLSGLTNSGVFNILSAGSATLKGTITNTGTIQVLSTGGGTDLFISGPVTLNGTGSVMMSNNGGNSILPLAGSGSLTSHSTIEGSGNIELAFTNLGSVIANQSVPLVIFSSISSSTNVFRNSGTLTVNPGSTLQIMGVFKNLSSGGTLTGGTYKVSGILQLPGDITTNAAKLTLTGTASQIQDASAANALSKLAANAASGGITLASNQNFTTSVAFSNAGMVKVPTGSTFTSASYTQTAGTTTLGGTLTTSPPSGAIAINGGSVFGGGGTLAADVSSGGTITPAASSTATGKLIVNGTYTQNSTGALDIRIASALKSSQIVVSGAATLGGTLNISRPTSFIPAMNAKFKILTCSSRTNMFSTVNGAGINTTEHFQVQYNLGDVTLVVMPGP
ncbi:MAG TPA: hypothetical protein VGT03_08280 [Candidatus Acidoferrales bacterium]|nr:hypothetical protein [Candidatus Acidoferrales bacterium]